MPTRRTIDTVSRKAGVFKDGVVQGEWKAPSGSKVTNAGFNVIMDNFQVGHIKDVHHDDCAVTWEFATGTWGSFEVEVWADVEEPDRDKPDSYTFYDVHYDLRELRQKHDNITIDTVSTTNKDSNEAIVILQKTCTEESSQNWGHAVGCKLGVKTTFTAGIPLIGEASAELSAEASYEHTMGKSHSETKSTQVSVQVTVPPRSQMSANCMAKKTLIDVPYTATVDTVKNGEVIDRKATSGVFKGIQCHSFEMQVLPAVKIPTLGGGKQ